MIEKISTQIVIIGGGPVGATFACALASAGIHSIIIDKNPIEKQKELNTDGRAISVNGASRNLLKTLGIWEKIPKSEIQPINTIKTLNKEEKKGLLFVDLEDHGQGLGSIIEMPFLRKAIIEKVEDYIKNGVIKWIGNTTIQDINFDNPCAEVITENNEKFLSPCIVGADGRNSTTRNLANIQAKQKSYDQKAIVCTYKHSNDHNDMAYEIFLPSGPFAILPMTRKRSSVVWSLDQVIADTLLKEANEKIDFKITQLMAPYLSDLERIGKVWTYPLGLSYVNKYSVNRCALIGDAAHAIHPLAGQGVNLGFKDAAILAEIIANSIKLGIDYGTSSVLEQYDKWRKLDIYSLIIMTDSLNKLFSNSSKTLNFVRGKGLQLVNKMPFLKNSLENHAKGFSGKIPKLIKGEQLL